MLDIPSDDPLAVEIVGAIQSGDVEKLQRLLEASPELATARIVNQRGGARTLLHVAADWPGHFPNGAKTVAALIAAGADPNAPMVGPHAETPLHWAASCDDGAVLDALLDGGADIEAPGAIFTGGAPMSDAVIFAQWSAARRLLERGAWTTIWQAAALGLLSRVQECCAAEPPPEQDQITNAFWHACRGGQRQSAEYLLARGANLNWVGHDNHTPLDAAERTTNDDFVAWLKSQGARSATTNEWQPDISSASDSDADQYRER